MCIHVSTNTLWCTWGGQMTTCRVSSFLHHLGFNYQTQGIRFGIRNLYTPETAWDPRVFILSKIIPYWFFLVSILWSHIPPHMPTVTTVLILITRGQFFWVLKFIKTEPHCFVLGIFHLKNILWVINSTYWCPYNRIVYLTCALWIYIHQLTFLT